MKKTRHYYQSYFQHYELGNEALITNNELLNWYSKTKVKPHTDIIDNEQYVYTWEFVEEEKLPQFFIYVGSKDVDINQDIVKLGESDFMEVNWQSNWKNLEKRKVG